MKRQRNTFLTPLVVEVMPLGKRFKLHYDFTYRWRFMDGGFQCEFVCRVPADFETDFASIPRFARILIPKLGKYNKAAVVHDFIYQSDSINLTRSQADRCFLRGMADLGVPRWKRYVMYWAVRLGGWMAWQKR